MKLLLRHACAITLMLGFAASAQTIPGSTPPAGETSTTTHVVRYKGSIAAPQGVVNLTFSLYAAETGGTAVWSETQNVTIDNTGNFSALIGAGTTGGLPEAIFLNESAMWLGVAVTGQAENPRVLLVSVPYAMSAVEAERLGGHAASDFVLQSQLAAGGTTGGTGTTTTGGTVTPTVSGSTGYISKFSAADSVDDSVIYQDGSGRIGFFTTTIPNDPSDDTKVKIAGRLRVEVANTPSAPDKTTSVATFSNNVTPSVDQTASHQAFISNVAINGTKSVYQAVGGLFEADQFGASNITQLFGGNASVYMGDPSVGGTVNQAVAFNNDAFNGSGTAQNLIGIRTSANTSSDYGTSTQTVNQVGVLVDSNTHSGGSVTNNYGLLVNNQNGVGANNWAIKTGTGLVDFGDKTQFAVATANRASLNIPLGSAPTAPQEGDVWNQGGAIKFISSGTARTLATLDDLAPTTSNLAALQTALTSETNARTAADTTLQNNISAEAATRASADTALNNSITSLQSSLTTLDSGSAKLAGNNAFTGTNDFSAATATSPVQVVGTLPTSCVGGKQMVVLSTDPAGKQLYICNADNATWSLVGDGAPGAATSSDLTALQTALTNETNARSSADTTLQNNINTVAGNLTAETSARTAADTTLQTNINTVASNLTAETTARTAADTTLQSNIDAANAAITAETSARTAADTTLQTNINTVASNLTAETTARQAADTTLQTNITNEASARTAADTTLQSNIDAANTAVTNETSARTAADTTLQNNINSEATTRSTADTTLQSNIAAEAATRASADTALSNSITSLQNSLSTLDSGSAKLAGNNTFTGANDFSGASSTAPVKVVTIATTPSTCAANKDLIVKSDAPAGQQLFICNAAGNGYVLVGDGSGTVTSIATGSGLTGGPITSSGTISIATGGVTNAMLANSGVTVTAGTGLSGGGAVSLGGTITLNNTGALSFNGRTGAVTPAANDYSFAQISGTAGASQGGTGVTSSGAAGNFLRSNGTAWASSAIQASDLPSLSTTYVDLSSAQTIAGTKTFSSTISGNISGTASNVTGTVAVANGGTGSTTAAGARTNLGAAASGANSDITSLSGLTTALSAAQGGTGITSSGAGGNVLRSNGTTWASSAIQASDLPSLSSTYVDLSSAQTIAGTKTFSSTISGSISGTASNVTGTVAAANGGTGLTSAGASGNILVSNGTTWTSSAPTILSGNYVDLTTNQSIAGTKTFTGVVDHSVATQTLPVRAVTVATMGTSCTANKEMIVVTDGQPGRQLWLCNSAGTGWNLLGDGIGGNGVTFNAVNVPANSLLLTKNTCSATYTGTYPTVVAGQDIPIPPATGTLTQQSTLVVSPISSMTNSMPAGWTSYQYYAYVDSSNQAFLHVCNPTQNNISALSGGSGAITFNVRAIN